MPTSPLLGGDLVKNTQVGAPHPKPLKVAAVAPALVHGDLTGNTQVGAVKPEPVSLTLPDGTDFAAWYATVKAYITAHP